MKKVIAKLLLFVMILNTILANVTSIIFAQAKNGTLGFEWIKQAILNDALEQINRPPDSDEILLKWDIDKVNATNNDTGLHILRYPIDKDKVIEFTAKKESGNFVTIEYKVNNESKVTKSGEKKLTIYKDGTYIDANKTNFPETSDFKLDFYPSGDVKSTKIKMSTGKGVAFKYMNNTIKVLYKDGKLYFNTDNIKKGNIYPFDLIFNKNGNSVSESDIKDTKNIFIGINITAVNPFANATENPPEDKGKELIDQTKRPIAENNYPGGDIVGVDITFDIPKEWKNDPSVMARESVSSNNTKGDFKSLEKNGKKFKLVFDIEHLNVSKNLQVTIPSIFEDKAEITKNNAGSTKVEASYKYDNTTNKGIVTLKHLESSTIYSGMKVSSDTEGSITKFESIPSVYPTGIVYTYPKYRIIALGLREYYLEIEPFEGYNGFYRVLQGSTEGELGSWATYEEKANGSNKILIPVSLDAETGQEKYFRVDFSFTPPSLETNKLPFTSQLLKFKPSKEDIVLPIPKNLKIISSNIIRKDDEPEYLFLDLKWDIGYESTIKLLMERNGQEEGGKEETSVLKPFSVDYVFNKGFTPEMLEKEAFMGANLTFSISKTTPSEPTESTQTKDEVTIEYKQTDNDKNGGQKHGIELLTERCETTKRIETVGNAVNTILEANVTFKIPVSSKTDTDKKVLEYINTYFLATKGIYQIKSQNYDTGFSLPVTLTLNGLTNIEIPAPQNLQVIPGSVAEHKFSVEYDTMKYKEKEDILYNYNEVMLKTIDRFLKDDSIKYNFYITQDRALFDELIKHGEEKNLPPDIESVTTTLSINDKPSPPPVDNEDKPEEEPEQPKPLQGITVDFKQNGLIDRLRTKGVVALIDISQDINVLKQHLNFIGLDENETYYVIGRTSITPYEKIKKPEESGSSLATRENKSKERENSSPAEPETPQEQEGTILNDKKSYSKYSRIVTATTKKDGDNPTENEKVPPAPNKFIAKDITLNSVNLIWDKVKDDVLDDKNKKSTLEYQFIKTRGEQLPDSFLKSKYSFEKTWQDLANVKNKAGIRTQKDKIYEFDAEAKKFSQEPSDPKRYQYVNWEGSEGNILDSTLSPNQIYFYYIRTVRISEKGDEAYSIWVPLSFTTKNPTGPKNLRVEPKAKYDKKSEVVISFDIPKLDLDIIGTEYDLQYSIKEDLGEWSQDKTMPKDKLTFTENPDGKTLKVTYKITGLKSGTLYTIRVRMFHRPLQAPSVYSNELEHRTDSDNADNDYDQDVENWEKHFKDLIEELKNSPYWYLQNDASNTIVYYRPQYFDKIIGSSNTSIIDLALGVGANHKEYYLPASAITKAFDSNKGFKVSKDGADVIISAKTINPNENEVIKKLSEEIGSKKEKTKDYFVKLTIDFKSGNYVINGNNSVSPSVQIDIAGIGTKDEIVEVDKKALEYIDELLKSKEFSTDVKKKIEKLITDKTENKILIQEVDKIVDTFKTKFGSDLSKKIKNTSKETNTMQRLNGNIIYLYTIQSNITVSGYKKVKDNWATVDIKDYLGKKAIYTNEPGEYIFTGKKLVIVGLETLPNSQLITSIINKYGLDDFLGKDGNINLRAPITRRSTIGSLARISGASKTQDPIEFFKTKGIVLSTRNIDNNITSEEAVYLIMKVYEMKTNTKLDTIKIRNYNTLKDVKNINSNYKKPIQVAFEMGIYTNPNMIAKGTISVQEFLQTITNMATKVGL